MQVSDSAIGIMDGAFFVPKTQLLDWVNKLLVLNLSKVEQCASGAVYCQIVDSLFQGKVPMKKVNFAAKLEYEFVNNYKLLQKSFDDCRIAKYIDVDKLIRGKFQDNLEFLQWIKSFHDSHKDQSYPDSYDPLSRRYGAVLEWAKPGRASPPSASPNKKDQNSLTAQLAPMTEAEIAADYAVASARSSSHPTTTVSKHDILKKTQRELKDAEGERDFYFGKLREIEVLTDSLEANENPIIKNLVARIQKILFTSEPSPLARPS